MRLRRRKNLIPRLAEVAPWLWPEPETDAAPGPEELLGGRRLSVEIGCGMGDFITRMALLHPEEVFVAVERDKNVAVRAMEKTRDLMLENIRFCLCDAGELERLLPQGRVSGLYLNFSDPWPHWKHRQRRLTYRRYLDLYSTLLEPQGSLILKTDNRDLFRFSESELRERQWRIVSVDEDFPDGDGNVCTEYEIRFRAEAQPIYRIVAQVPAANDRV